MRMSPPGQNSPDRWIQSTHLTSIRGINAFAIILIEKQSCFLTWTSFFPDKNLQVYCWTRLFASSFKSVLLLLRFGMANVQPQNHLLMILKHCVEVPGTSRNSINYPFDWRFFSGNHSISLKVSCLMPMSFIHHPYMSRWPGCSAAIAGESGGLSDQTCKDMENSTWNSSKPPKKLRGPTMIFA